MNIADIFDKVSKYLGSGTNWGRWVGGAIVAVILFLWTFLSLKDGKFIPLDAITAAILLLVFIAGNTPFNTRPPDDPSQTKLPGI